MKRFVITQYGVQEAEVARSFVLEVPDDMTEEDVDALDEDRLETLADEAGVGWNEPEFTDLQADRHYLEGEAEQMASDHMEVVKWSEENT